MNYRWMSCVLFLLLKPTCLSVDSKMIKDSESGLNDANARIGRDYRTIKTCKNRPAERIKDGKLETVFSRDSIIAV